MTANAARQLIQHYVDNFRQLPWRSAPGDPPPNPYVVWLSEVMLQQTTVAAVGPRFESFIARWPTIEALAAAPDSEILSEWAGLGYYARARNLIACAREVSLRGGFPHSAAELCKLPGIGAYTGAAIAAIAFGEKAPAVDTNVERVIARLLGLKTPNRREIEGQVSAFMGEGSPGDVLQALMDLGATICRPRQPLCSKCPIQASCAAALNGHAEEFPAPRKRKVRPNRYGTAWWIERQQSIWLVRRPRSGLLGGMAALPGNDWSETVPATTNAIATIRHAFTHFTLELSVELCPKTLGEGWWQPINRLDEAGLPSLYAKAVREVLRWRESLAA